jgi:cytochrome c553
MKKIIAALLTLGSLTLSLQAYDQAERIQDMQTMEISMVEIQRGILYNNKAMALKGVNSLKKASRKVEVSKKDDMDYSVTFAKKQAENIIRYADKLEANIEANQKHAATTNYTKILNQCVSCHNKIRKWNQ